MAPKRTQLHLRAILSTVHSKPLRHWCCVVKPPCDSPARLAAPRRGGGAAAAGGRDRRTPGCRRPLRPLGPSPPPIRLRASAIDFRRRFFLPAEERGTSPVASGEPAHSFGRGPLRQRLPSLNSSFGNPPFVARVACSWKLRPSDPLHSYHIPDQSQSPTVFLVFVVVRSVPVPMRPTPSCASSRPAGR